MRRTILSLALLAVAGQLQAAELLLTIETSGSTLQTQPLQQPPPSMDIGFVLDGIGHTWTVRPADVGTTFEVPPEPLANLAEKFTDSTTHQGLYGFVVTCCGADFPYLSIDHSRTYSAGDDMAIVTRHVPLISHELYGYHITSITDTLDAFTFTESQFPHGVSQISGRATLRIYGDPIPPVPGDFNQNGEVDAADYVLWRDRNGTDGSLPNESGKTPLDITQEDYEFWRANFGHGSDPVPSALGLGSQSIPEPTTWFIATVGSTLLHLFGRRRSRQR